MQCALNHIKHLLTQLAGYSFDSKFFIWSFERIAELNRNRSEFLAQGPRGTLANEPVLTKHNIRSVGEVKFINPNYTGRKFTKRTSGSSGQPMTIYKSEHVALAEIYLVPWKAMQIGELPETSLVRSLFITDNPESCSAILLDPSGETPHLLMRRALGENQDWGFEQLVRDIQVAKPQLVTSNPNLLQAFADFCERRSINITQLPFEGFLCTGGMLSDTVEKRLLKLAPAGILLNAYVSSEFGFMGARCPNGFWHLDEVRSFYECAEDGKLLISSTQNELMPLPRYEIGDRVSLPAINLCTCGGQGFLLSRLDGRSLIDFVIDGNRRISPSVYMHIFASFPELEEYQLEQNSPNSFTLRIEKRDEEFRVEAFLTAIKEPLGDQVSIDWSWAERLSHDKFQRFRTCI